MLFLCVNSVELMPSEIWVSFYYIHNICIHIYICIFVLCLLWTCLYLFILSRYDIHASLYCLLHSLVSQVSAPFCLFCSGALLRVPFESCHIWNFLCLNRIFLNAQILKWWLFLLVALSKFLVEKYCMNLH